jgi:hypothetical protein
MSTGLLIVMATATAVTVIILALVLTKFVRTVVENASELVPDVARVPGRLTRRLSRVARTQRSLGAERVRPARPPRLAGGEILPAAGDKRTAPVAEDVPPGRSVDVKFRQPKAGSTEPVDQIAERQPEPAGSVDSDSPAYRQVGEEVAAVLTAAEHAAAQIREAALRDAEATRRDADEQAGSVLAAAQARRAEADSYSQETRAAADAYAEETRRNTEELTATSVAKAEEQARQIRAQAEKGARDLQAAAIRRREDLAKGAEAMEARIESMRTVMRGIVAELEELVPADRPRAEEPEPRADKRLDESPKPASPHRAG